MNFRDNLRIKQIGKGSFSTVFLCKRNESEESKANNEGSVLSSFILGDLFGEQRERSTKTDAFFIIKEINVNTLVKRYASSKRKDKFQSVAGDDYSPSFENMSITPYNRGNSLFSKKKLEYDYYYDRLRSLIQSEIEILKLLEHPNIVAFYDYVISDNVYSLYTEYCNKGDVYQILKSGVAPNGHRNSMGGIGGVFLFQFIKQVSCGLDYLEKQNIIHRDIKLHNILLHTEQDEEQLYFKISDFGFACYNIKAQIEDSELNESSSRVLENKYYKLCGSPYYMAPEIIRNIRLLENYTQYTQDNSSRRKKLPLFYDTKYDVYSFGMCLYELICNHLPLPKIKDISDLEKFYKGTSSQQTIDQRIFKNKHIDIILQELLAKLLRVDHIFRPCANEVLQFFYKNRESLRIACTNNDKEDTNEFQNTQSCISQAELKEHVVNQPINPIREDKGEHSSWHYINNSISLIRNIDAERGFLDWLLRNNNKQK